MNNATGGEWAWAIGNGAGVALCLFWWGLVWFRGRRASKAGNNGALRILYILKHALCFVLTFAEGAFTTLGVQAMSIPEPVRDPLREQQRALVWVFVLVPVFIIGYVAAELAYRRKLDDLIDRADAIRLLKVPTKEERAEARQVIRDTEPDAHGGE